MSYLLKIDLRLLVTCNCKLMTHVALTLTRMIFIPVILHSNPLFSLTPLLLHLLSFTVKCELPKAEKILFHFVLGYGPYGWWFSSNQFRFIFKHIKASATINFNFMYKTKTITYSIKVNSNKIATKLNRTIFLKELQLSDYKKKK